MFFRKKKKPEKEASVENTVPDSAHLETEAEILPQPEVLEPVAPQAKAPAPKKTTAKKAKSEKIESEEAAPDAGWISRLRKGLGKSSGKIAEGLGGISGLVTRRKLDNALLEELEDVLISADMGVKTAASLTQALAKSRFDKDISDSEIREAFAGHITEILAPVARPLTVDTTKKPFVITMVGVNGNGKTTTIAKLAQRYQSEGYCVMLAAADTFRAAAVEQLQTWGERLGCKVITGKPEADPASVAFSAYERAVAAGVDILLVDTAGRLQNKTGLMQELQKIIRVLGKQDETAPHATVLVLDATTGQNAHSQVKTFQEMVNINGLIVTKLDGSAKGGVVVALAESFHLPIHAVGVGEKADDLRPFEAKDFARSLMGISDCHSPT